MAVTNLSVSNIAVAQTRPRWWYWIEPQEPGFEKNVATIEYGNQNFSNLTLDTVNYLYINWDENRDDGSNFTKYIQMWGGPSVFPGQNQDLHNMYQWQQWYQMAKQKTYYVNTRAQTSNGIRKARLAIKVPYLFAERSRHIELCFTFVADVYPGDNVQDLFYLLRQDQNGNDLADYMWLSDLRAPEGAYCSNAWMRNNSPESGAVRGLFRTHIAIGFYQYIERIGLGNNKTFLRV
jgi:hypothetical protein